MNGINASCEDVTQALPDVLDGASTYAYRPENTSDLVVLEECGMAKWRVRCSENPRCAWTLRKQACLRDLVRARVDRVAQLRQRHPLEVKTFACFSGLGLALRALGSPWLEPSLLSLVGVSPGSAWGAYIATAIGQMASGTTVACFGLLIALIVYWGQLPPLE